METRKLTKVIAQKNVETLKNAVNNLYFKYSRNDQNQEILRDYSKKLTKSYLEDFWDFPAIHKNQMA